MSSVSNPFISSRTPSVLKNYFDLSNSDSLKEKDSYWVTYKKVRKCSDNGDLPWFATTDDEESASILSPKISVYRYLCNLFCDAPAYLLQTGLDSYMKTLEISAAAQQSNTRRHRQFISNNLDSSVDYAREYLEMLASNEDWGLSLQILPESCFQFPNQMFSPSNMENFGWIPFRIINTDVSWGYNYRDSSYGYHGRCANSPYRNADGFYILMTFPAQRDQGYATSFKSKRPFYADYVFFKVKEKHTRHIYPRREPNGEQGETQFRCGDKTVDIVAMTPEDYDDNMNNQLSMGVESNRTGTWEPLNLSGGFHRSWAKRKTQIRWSYSPEARNIDLERDLLKVKWKFTGQYYGDFYNTIINPEQVPDLQTFEITTDEGYRGKGKIFVDRDKILYCPLTGHALLSTSRISNVQARFLEHGPRYWR